MPNTAGDLQAYQSIRKAICTGTIVLVEGLGPISDLIRMGQLIAGHGRIASKWTHVGLAYRDPITDAVLLLESTTLSGEIDTLTGVKRSGVQLVSLSSRLRNHKGRIAVRIPSRCPDDHQIIALGECIQKYKGVPYEEDKLQLIRAVFDRIRGDDDGTQDVSSLFCSELVALLLQAMGWLPAWIPDDSLGTPTTQGVVWPLRNAKEAHNRPADEWVPADFAHHCLKLKGTTVSMPITISQREGFYEEGAWDSSLRRPGWMRDDNH